MPATLRLLAWVRSNGSVSSWSCGVHVTLQWRLFTAVRVIFWFCSVPTKRVLSRDHLLSYFLAAHVSTRPHQGTVCGGAASVQHHWCSNVREDYHLVRTHWTPRMAVVVSHRMNPSDSAESTCAVCTCKRTAECDVVACRGQMCPWRLRSMQITVKQVPNVHSCKIDSFCSSTCPHLGALTVILGVA